MPCTGLDLSDHLPSETPYNIAANRFVHILLRPPSWPHFRRVQLLPSAGKFSFGIGGTGTRIHSRYLDDLVGERGR